MINYVIDEKGEEVISERHQKDYKKETDEMPMAAESTSESHETDTSNFTDIEFDDI
jgi:hypothetical protein